MGAEQPIKPFLREKIPYSKLGRIGPAKLRTAGGTANAVYEASSTSAKNLRSEAKNMGDSTRVVLSVMPRILMEAQLEHPAVTGAFSHIENVEVLETHIVARDFQTSTSKVLSSEGLTSGTFLNNQLGLLVAPQEALEELVGCKIKISNAVTHGTGLIPGLTENLRLRNSHRLDMPGRLKTIGASYPFASRNVRAMNSDADSAATNNLLVSLDSATNSSAIKLFGEALAFLLPEGKCGFSNLVHLATDMFNSGIPSVTIHRMLHERLKGFHQSFKIYIRSD